MVELDIEDITYTQGLAMGARMEMALGTTRLQLVGGAVLRAAKRAAEWMNSGDLYGIAALADTNAAHLYGEPQPIKPDPPAEEA